MRLSSFSILLCVLLMSTVVFAEDNKNAQPLDNMSDFTSSYVKKDVSVKEVALSGTPAPETDATTAPAVAPTTKEPVSIAATTKPVADTGLVSLNFQDVDIRNVLKVLAYKSGTNVVTTPEVTGTVTIQLNDVPWKKALDVILSTYGYGYERQGNIITVMPIDSLKKHREDTAALQEQEPLVTKTYLLSYAKASDIMDSINKIKSPKGTINFDARTNALIIREVSSNLELIDTVIKTLDSVTPQVLIEAKVVETTLGTDDKLGVDWAIKASATGSKRSLALPWNISDASNLLPAPAAAPTSTFTLGTLDATTVSAVFQMLSSKTDTNILSNPKIITLDNQPAKIVVGTQYPIPNYTYNADQGKMQVSGWEYKDIGIIFEVTPHVNNPGMVTLELHPVITDITGTVTVENTSLPQLSVEETRTKVMIEDGQTLVIAGLIKDKTEFTKGKVPFLGDMPILGEAFKKTSTVKSKTELLVFLTPHIIIPGKQKEAIAAVTEK